MTEKLKGKVAVITGAGGEIGKAVALGMAAEGAKVVVNDFSRDPDGNSLADKVAEEIKKNNGVAVASYDGVHTMSGGENIIKTATDNFGRIDILVNCAGNMKKVESITHMTEEEWDSMISVHLKGHFSCIKAAATQMKQQKSGRIINIASQAAFSYGFGPGIKLGITLGAYAAAKAGILGLTATLSAELGEYGITVNAILPSAITKLFPEARPRFGGGMTEEADAVAPIMVYLATDEAQKITGQFIYTCAGDLCIFARPIQLPGPHMFVRKMGKWTVDELIEVIPPIAGVK